MNVLFFLSDDNDGVAFHRLSLPSEYIQGVEVRKRVANIYDNDLEWADVLIISRQIDGRPEHIRSSCDKFNVKLIVDVDDLWILPTNHILHSYYQRIGYGAKQEAYLRIADQVWTTNIRLAEEIKSFNKNVHIIPNALPFGEGQFTDEKIESDRVRFFYAGGHTHRHDIALLSDVNRELRKDQGFKEQGQFVLAGGFEGVKDVYVHGVWDSMEKDFSGHAVGKHTYKRLYSKNTDNYMELYREADVGLIPLEDNRFTRCKSNLKLLECACKGIPVIVSDVATYHDNEPPVIFCKGNDFVIAVKKMVNNPKIRWLLGHGLALWAKEHHNLHEVNKLREEALKQLK